MDKLTAEQIVVLIGLGVLAWIPSFVLLGGILAVIGDVIYQRYLQHKERNFKFLQWDEVNTRLTQMEANSVRLEGSVTKCNEGIGGVNAALSMLRR